MPRVTIPNPLTDGADEVIIVFKVILPPEWRLLDGEEIAALMDDEETAVEILVKRVERIDEDGDREDISEMFTAAVDVEELAEEIRKLYVEQKLEGYVDRLLR